MRILIPWDGAQNPESIIRDLHYAGLPAQAHTLVLSLVHAFMPVPARAFVASNNDDAFDTMQDERGALEANRAKIILLRHFPDWYIEYEEIDAPAARSAGLIMQHARAWNADLIVIGSGRHTRSLTTAAARIADEAPCSVRIVHPRHQHPDAPLNVLLYVDGTAESLLMVEEFAARSFPRNTCIHLISIVDEREWNIERVHHMLDYFADHVRQEFPHIESQIRYGDPAEQILRYANHQEIDSIFVAAPESAVDTRIATAIQQQAESTVEIFKKHIGPNDERSGKQ